MRFHWDSTDKKSISSVDVDVLIKTYQKKIKDLKRRLSEGME
jgi:hypothetical protein